MNKINWYMIVILVLSAVVLDLDRLAFYSPIGRLAIFDILTILFVAINLFKIKYFKSNRALNIFFILMLILVFYQITSGYILFQSSVYISYSNVIAVAFKYFIYSLVAFFITNYLISNDATNNYVDIWMRSSLVVVAIGIFQILAINSVPFFSNYFLWENIRGGGHRIAATFRWQGVLVFYLCIMIPLVLGKLLDNENAIFKKKRNDVIVLLLMLMIGFYSGSRSVFVVFFSTALMFFLKPFIKNNFRISYRKVLALLFSIAPVYYFLNNFLLNSRAVRRVLGLEGAVGVTTGISPRQRIIQAGIEAWERSPIMGIGTGNFSRSTGLAAHNSYLEILVENGILGLGIYIMILLLFSKIIISLFFVSLNRKKMFPVSIAFSLVNILIYQVTASAIQYRLFWIYLPIVFSYHYIYYLDKKKSYCD